MMSPTDQPTTFAEIAASAARASPLRTAFADVLHRYLSEHGSAAYDELVRELVDGGAWTHDALEEALEDLAYDARVNIRGDLGWVEVELLLEAAA